MKRTIICKYDKNDTIYFIDKTVVHGTCPCHICEGKGEIEILHSEDNIIIPCIKCNGAKTIPVCENRFYVREDKIGSINVSIMDGDLCELDIITYGLKMSRQSISEVLLYGNKEDAETACKEFNKGYDLQIKRPN